MKKSIAVLGLACITLLLASGCSRAKYKFAVVPGGTHPFWAPAERAAKDAARDLGIPEPFFAAPPMFDQPKQDEILKQVIDLQCSAIAMQTADPTLGNLRITDLARRGIPSVTMAGPPDYPSMALYCLATDTRKSAYEGATRLIEAMGGKGNIVHLTGYTSERNTRFRVDGVAQAVEEHKGVELLETILDIDIEDKAAQAIAALLASKKDKIDGIIATAYIPSTALVAELKKLNDARIKAVVIDQDPAVLDGIRNGTITGTMTQNPYCMVYISVYSLKLLQDGYMWKMNNPFMIDSGSAYVTKENVDSVDKMLDAATKKMFAEWRDQYFDAPGK